MASNADPTKNESAPAIEIIDESDNDQLVEETWVEQKEKSCTVLTELTHDMVHLGVNLGEEGDAKPGGANALYIDQNTAQRFSDLQAQLGYDQPSKVLDWLMDTAAHAIHQQEKHQLQLENQGGLTLPLSPAAQNQELCRVKKVKGGLTLPLSQEVESSSMCVESSTSNCFVEDKEYPTSDWPQIEELPRNRLKVRKQGVTLALLPGTESSANNCSIEKETPTSSPRLQKVVKIVEESKVYSDPQASCLIQHSGAAGLVNSACESYASSSTGVGIERECLNCLHYCGIFPKDYEIDKDTLIQLWMAAGFVTNEPMEDVSAKFLPVLECRNIISFSRQDLSSGKELYKINHIAFSDDIPSRISHVRVDAGNPTPLSTTLDGPCHVTVQHSSIDFEVLKKLTEIKTLLFLRGHGSSFKHVPYDFFTLLKDLETLDLSGTRLLELSSSISNAKCLRYLDLSHTLIRQLPETIGHLQFLQTLKLHKCPRLIALPIRMTKLKSLRHLELDTPCRICSMPPGMGALTTLRTLFEFPVGVESGCTVQEVKNMNYLRGSFCLSRLENVTSLDEAKEAKLCSKQWLKKLELRWSHKKQRNISLDDEVIQYLLPHTNIKYLRVLCYGGSAFPSWISDPSFVNLVSITLFKCENSRLLPSLGQLPSLESLSLYELTAVRTIDFHFCRDISVANGNNVSFPRLQKLEIISMLNLEDLRDPELDDFPCLAEMTIKDCPKLVALWRLGIFHLKHMELNNCPMLPFLPEGNLSIETLVVEGCPLLSSSCLKEDGQDWHKTVCVPNVFIDQLQGR